MRGPSKTPPKYRKHKATGQAIVNLGGKDHYLGPYGTKASKQEYDRLIGEWLANGRSLPVFQRMPTVTELVAKDWKFAIGYYVKNGKPTDEQPGLKVALAVLKGAYGKTTVDQFGPLSLVGTQSAASCSSNGNPQVARAGSGSGCGWPCPSERDANPCRTRSG